MQKALPDRFEESGPCQTNPQTVSLNTQAVAARMEDELGEEQVMFVEG